VLLGVPQGSVLDRCCILADLQMYADMTVNTSVLRRLPTTQPPVLRSFCMHYRHEQLDEGQLSATEPMQDVRGGWAWAPVSTQQLDKISTRNVLPLLSTVVTVMTARGLNPNYTPITQFWSFPANPDLPMGDGNQRRPLISLLPSATDSANSPQ